MPRAIAVLDSNIYRSLSEEALVALMEKERQVSVVASPCYQVVQELMAHLVPGDPEYGLCHAALSRMGRHCRYFNGYSYMFKFVADGLDQVAVAVFGRPVGDPAMPEVLAGLLGDIVEGCVLRNPEAFAADFAEIARHVRDARTDFAAAVRGIESELAAHLIGADDQERGLRDSGRRAVICKALESNSVLEGPAGMIYRQLAEWLDLPTNPLPPAGVARIVEGFPTPLRFFNRVVKGCICDGWRVEGKKRLGVAHDVRISFLISADARASGVPIWLVTDDQLIHDAAAAAGLANRVLQGPTYLDLLADADAIRALAEETSAKTT